MKSRKLVRASLQSDNPARREVLATLAELEASCADLESALQVHDWERLDLSMGDARRITHALEQVMEAAGVNGDESFDALIRERLERIHAIRERQVVRLSAYHEELGERLKTFVQFKAFARSIGARNLPPRRAGFDSKQ